MRVLLVSEFYPPITGGIAQHVRNLAIGLTRRGHEVVVVTSDSPRMVVQTKGNVKVFRVPHLLSNFDSAFMNRQMRYVPPFPDLLLLKTLTKIAKGFHPDVVHAHGWPMFTVVALKKRVRLPVISTLHDFGFFCVNRNCFNEDQKRTCHLRYPSIRKCASCARHVYGFAKALPLTALMSFSRKLLNDPDQIIVVSRYLGNVASEAGFVNIKVIPNFVNAEDLRRIEESPSDIPVHSIDVLYVGVLSPYKGIEVLFKAHDAIQKEHGETVNLVCVGRRYQKYALPSSLQTKIFTGVSRRFALSCMQRTKLVVVPSIAPETFSLVALEAMFFHKPVVASAAGGIKEVVENWETGRLVPPNDHMQLASAIRTLLKNPEEIESMGRKGRERLDTAFSEEKIVPQIEKIYDASGK